MRGCSTTNSIMKFNIVTLFPDVVSPHLSASIIGAAHDNGIIESKIVQIRDFAGDKHRTVDDTPYGGGPGMVMKVEPIHAALKSIGNEHPGKPTKKTVVLAARGKQFSQQRAQQYAELEELTLICGRYEGIDQRVADHMADEELSIGPYVLAGGELGALVVVEAVARLLPGVLGNPASLTEESHLAQASDDPSRQIHIEYPQYTKPASYQGWDVPDVLLSGDHSAITQWRDNHSQ